MNIFPCFKSSAAALAFFLGPLAWTQPFPETECVEASDMGGDCVAVAENLNAACA